MRTLLLLALATAALALPKEGASQTIHSPNQRLALTFALTPAGEPSYQLGYGTKTVIKPSRLGVLLRGGPGMEQGFVVAQVDSSTHDDTWAPVWGEVKQIRNHYRELAVTLRQPAQQNRTLVLRFRVFDDGLGFRYEWPRQRNLAYFTVTDERTEFNLPADHKAFWIPGDYDSNEYRYTTSRLSAVNTLPIKPIEMRAAPHTVQTPLMLKSDDGLYVNIHEAGLDNYSAMFLNVDTQSFALSSQLVPDAVGNMAYLQAPDHTPWRTVVVADNAPAVLSSKLILNLNEPSQEADPSYIKPQKFIGVWWLMQVGKATWNYADSTNLKLATTNWQGLTPNGRHGATTARVKQYIDFAAAHHIPGVLVEGWNVGWEDWVGNWKENVFDFVTPYPDFAVDELRQYAAGKGVNIIMHHETSGSATNYERRQEDAYKFMQDHGYTSVKTGYVGKIIPRGEHHDGQWMVRHYARAAQLTAARRLMIDMHEPVRPTGLHRTYPNWLACEAARGNEFNAFSEGNLPEHETILPFTRLMGGPMDYTPGIFKLKLDDYGPQEKGRQVHTTLAKQLALYVTMYSPLQMAADLPENYAPHLDAFKFIEDVPVDWDDTRIVAAEPGDYLTIARQAKGKNEWYLGSITDENARTQLVKLDFLPPGQRYEAIIYADGPGADWEKNPTSYRITKQVVTSKSTLKLRLAPGGGAAVSIKPVGK